MTDEEKVSGAREVQETIAYLKAEVRLLRATAKHDAVMVLWAKAQDMGGWGDSVLDEALETRNEFLCRLTPEEQDMLLEGAPKESI